MKDSLQASTSHYHHVLGMEATAVRSRNRSTKWHNPSVPPTMQCSGL